jgi:hypothetical protein
MDVAFRSCLPLSYRDVLERLVFFNPNQLRSQAEVLRALDMYGTPAIVSSGGSLHVTLSRCDDVQCLFALIERPGRASELAGMLIYRRTGIEDILIVHIAVADAYGENREGLSVVIRLLRAVRAAARRLKGVQRLRVLYRDGREFGIRVNAAGECSGTREPSEARRSTRIPHSPAA